MKRFPILLAAVTATVTFALTSCGKDAPILTDIVAEAGTVGESGEYEVRWNAKDAIFLTDGTCTGTCSIAEGAGTSTGVFRADGEFRLGPDLQACYPASMVSDGSYYWPETQDADLAVPMYFAGTLEGNGREKMAFTCLGAVLQIDFINATSKELVIKSIDVSDGEKPLSGRFTIDGQGRANIVSGGRDGIGIFLGRSGVRTGSSVTSFYAAIPAGEYRDLSFTLTANDNSKFKIRPGIVLDAAPASLCKVALTGSTVKEHVEGSLDGLFSTGPSSGDKVSFSRGSLYYNTGKGAFDFEPDQYDAVDGWDPDHVGHFFYCADGVNAAGYACNLVHSDYLFTNSSDGNGPGPRFTVAGVKGVYRALSVAEWKYMLASRPNSGALYKCNVTVCNVDYCFVLAPDDWDFDNYPLQKEYGNSSAPLTWEKAQKMGLVCIPPGGVRNNQGSVMPQWTRGTYWTSDSGMSVEFDISDVNTGLKMGSYQALPVRLVLDAE